MKTLIFIHTRITSINGVNVLLELQNIQQSTVKVTAK